MLTFGFTIDVEGILAETNSKRAMGRVMRQLHREIAELWLTEMLPRHFKAGAAGRYGYSQRSSGTREIRRRQHSRGFAVAPDLDLVRTGKTRDKATRTGVVRAWPSRAEAWFFVPSYITQRRSAKRAMNLIRELQRVSDDEAAAIRRFATKRIPELIAASKARRRHRG